MATFVIGFGVVALGTTLLAVGLLLRVRPPPAGCRGAGDCGGCGRPGAAREREV